MYTPIHCIALRTVPTTDRTSILTAWSAEMGRISIAIPSGESREARRRRALTMPLSTFEGVLNSRGKEIVTIRDMKPMAVACTLSAHPVKSIVAIFLADILTAALRDSQCDTALSTFLFDSVERLDRAEGTALANFHLHFLYSLTRYLGIEPDMSTWGIHRCFDMVEGRFCDSAPMHRRYIDADRAQGVRWLSRLNAANIGRVRISRRERNALLDGILEYYSLHHASMSGLRSVEILRQVLE